jgi:hypothetical protein
MEPEGSVLCSQESDTGFYCEPDESCPHLHTLNCISWRTSATGLRPYDKKISSDGKRLCRKSQISEKKTIKIYGIAITS